MKFRVNLRCTPCRWSTSRTPRPDHDYGACPRCAGTLREAKAREYFKTASGKVQHFRQKPPKPEPSTFNNLYAQKYGAGHTWPELVAAELERRDREQR